MILDSYMLTDSVGQRDAQISGWFNHEAGELASHFPVAAGDVVVAVGCGDGTMARFCAQRGARVLLVDTDSKAMDMARLNLAGLDTLVQTHVGEVNTLPIGDGAATRVICSGMLERVDDPAVLMKELVRVGAPGALYLLTVPGAKHEVLQQSLAPAVYFQKPNHLRIFDSHRFAALVGDAGLSIEHTGSHGFFWALWGLFFWQCDVPLTSATRHPCLDGWARAWGEVLKGKDGPRIQAALDNVLPKHQFIVARKPREIVMPKAGDPSLYECTRHMAEGERCSEAVMARLAGEIERRLVLANVDPRPSMPQLSDLRIRRAGLPDFWEQGNNVFLAAPGVATPNIRTGFFMQGPPKGGILVMGEGSSVNHVNTAGDAPLVCLGNRVDFNSVAVSSVGYCTVLVGEDSNATMWAQIDARNGGVVSVGADGMWAIGVYLMTDDTHAVRDVTSGKRLNRFGGKIVVGPHVWLGTNVQVLGDAYIGEHSIIGIGSLVKNSRLPPNTVCAGRPARVVREGVTWSREDVP